MSTQPAPPAKPPVPTVKPPQLGRLQRNAANGAIENVQDWLAANDAALRAQAHALIDRAAAWLQSVAKPGVDKGLDWLVAKINALKF